METGNALLLLCQWEARPTTAPCLQGALTMASQSKDFRLLPNASGRRLDMQSALYVSLSTNCQMMRQYRLVRVAVLPSWPSVRCVADTQFLLDSGVPDSGMPNQSGLTMCTIYLNESFNQASVSCQTNSVPK